MKKGWLLFAPILSLTMSGCGFGGTTIIHYDSTSAISIDPLQPDSGEGYKKINSFDFNLQDVKVTTGQHSLSSVGDSYLLVVPVEFSNAPKWSLSSLEVINKGFFGDASDTAWQSVSSFYRASSYGQLNIKGEVAKTLSIPLTVQEASAHKVDGKASPDEVAITYFNADSSYDELRKAYDTNGDGYIDSIAFVYSNQIDYSSDTEKDNGYWAWVYWNSERASTSLPVINSYLWMSYYFFTGSDYAGYGTDIDAHTAIHETGHLLGLDDYYQYDKEYKFDPSGGLEMHSFNIGDENIYSKLALGWVNPYYVKSSDSVTLSLRSSAIYGDAIIINDDWTGNSMDEYLIIEYYTPQGMNEKDSIFSYKPNRKQKTDKMFTENGFRIYHVDSRIVELEARGAFKRYVTELGKGFYSVGASNSPSRSCLVGKDKIDYKYLHLLESSGINTFKNGGIASNDTLFKKGSSFVASSEFFPNGSKFNSGIEVGYRVSINDCNAEFGSITISKI